MRRLTEKTEKPPATPLTARWGDAILKLLPPANDHMANNYGGSG